jgi:hypothetical protein
LDTKFGLSAFQLTPLGQSIGDSESSLLPTPNAGNFNDGESLESWEARRQKNKDKGINGNGQGTPLAIAAKLWPTPQAHDAAKGDPERVGRFGTEHGGRNLNDEVMLLPTPRKEGYDSQGRGHGDLQYEVKNRLYPTITASQNSTIADWEQRAAHSSRKPEYQDCSQGSLNPEFVCQLMGYPTDWTELKGEMPRTAKPQADKICLNCGNTFNRTRYNGTLEDNTRFQKRRFCSLTCMGTFKRKEKPTRRALLKRIRHLRKGQCEECGTTENLSHHHKDLDWTNNDPLNLATLCSRCHLLLHHRLCKGGRLETGPRNLKHWETLLSRSKPIRSSKRSRSAPGITVELDYRPGVIIELRL